MDDFDKFNDDDEQLQLEKEFEEGGEYGMGPQ